MVVTAVKQDEFDDDFARERASKGGKARAESLTSEERKDIGKRAVMARWNKQIEQTGNNIKQAICYGDFEIAGKPVSAAVLEGEKRVITQRALFRAIGRAGSPMAIRGHVFNRPSFLAPKNLQPFIPQELDTSSEPILFRLPDNGPVASGYAAELLPLVCYVYIDAHKAGVLAKNQLHIAEACEVLVRGFATVGINALIDEATGYQYMRGRHALEEILNTFVAKELAKWAKRFPDEFYRQIFRLRGWPYDEKSIKKRPGIVGEYTNDLVYARLAPGVLEELRKKNPANQSGCRPHRHHQWLTADVGHPELRDHLTSIIALMKGATNWDAFKLTADRAFPRFNSTVDMFPEVPITLL